MPLTHPVLARDGFRSDTAALGSIQSRHGSDGRATRRLPSWTLFPLLCFIYLSLPPLVSSQSLPTATTSSSSLASSTPPSPTPMPDPSAHKQNLAADAETTSMSHWVDINVSPPVTCEPMNITFDPRRGTPPFQVMITVEDWWPYTVELSPTYDAPDKQLWLYQFNVPTFAGATPNPNIIVSVTDSTGLMSNSSSFTQVTNGTNMACPSYFGGVDFIFYTERSPSQCDEFDIFWSGAYVAPVSVMMLPERAAPIGFAASNTSAGQMTWGMVMPGGTRFMMTMGDTGAYGNGGVSRINIVGLNEYASDDCLSKTSFDRNLLVPWSMLSSATVFSDVTSTLRSVLTANGQVSTVTVRETVRNGRKVSSDSSSPVALIGGLVGIGVAIGIGGGLVVWCLCRRRARRSGGVKTWDLPSDPSMPFNIKTSLPIAPGLFGKKKNLKLGRSGGDDVARRGPSDRHRPLESDDGDSARPPSPAGTNIFHDPVPRGNGQGHGGQTHGNAGSQRGSLRSWASSAFEAVGLRGGSGGGLGQERDAYPLTQTFLSPTASAAHSRSGTPAYAGGGYRPHLQLQRGSIGAGTDGSPVDSSVGPFSAFRDDPSSPEGLGGGSGGDTWRSAGGRSHFGSGGGSLPSEDDIASPMDRSPWPGHPSHAHPPGTGVGVARDGTTKTTSGRVGAGATYRSDFASAEAAEAYEDLISPGARGGHGTRYDGSNADRDDFLQYHGQHHGQHQHQHQHYGQQGTANSRARRAYDHTNTSSYSSSRFHLTGNPFDDSNDVSIPMRRDPSSAPGYGPGGGRGSSGNRNSSSHGTNRNGTTRIIHHADAGLLLDDTADGDGEYPERIMELPPQYETITRISPSSPTALPTSPGALAGAGSRGWMQRDSDTFAAPTTLPQSSTAAGAGSTRAADEVDEDEDDFWTGPAAAAVAAGADARRTSDGGAAATSHANTDTAAHGAAL